MVLILPEALPDRYCPKGAAADGLVASVRAALHAECPDAAEGVTVRMAGSFIIVEGVVPDDGCIDRIRQIAEDIAGSANVSLCLFRQ